MWCVLEKHFVLAHIHMLVVDIFLSCLRISSPYNERKYNTLTCYMLRFC